MLCPNRSHDGIDGGVEEQFAGIDSFLIAAAQSGIGMTETVNHIDDIVPDTLGEFHFDVEVGSSSVFVAPRQSSTTCWAPTADRS